MSFLSILLFCAALKASPLVQLQLDAPPQCPSKDSIERTLARLVQRAPATPLPVSARLAPDGQSWVLVAMLEGGQRVVGGDSCVAVAEALVVIMALAIDPASPVNAPTLLEFEHANAAAETGTRPADPVLPAVPVAGAPRTASAWRVTEMQGQARLSGTAGTTDGSPRERAALRVGQVCVSRVGLSSQ